MPGAIRQRQTVGRFLKGENFRSHGGWCSSQITQRPQCEALKWRRKLVFASHMVHGVTPGSRTCMLMHVRAWHHVLRPPIQVTLSGGWHMPAAPRITFILFVILQDDVNFLNFKAPTVTSLIYFNSEHSVRLWFHGMILVKWLYHSHFKAHVLPNRNNVMFSLITLKLPYKGHVRKEYYELTS